MVDNPAGICCSGEVKFLPRSSSLLLLTVALSLSACATAANRRALYFPAKPGGVWHDYETRRYAEAQTGISTTAYTTTTTTTTTGTKTPNPPSRPIRGGADIGSPTMPAPGSTTPADAGLPQTPTAAPAPDATSPTTPAQ